MRKGRGGWNDIERMWSEHLARRSEAELPLWLVLGIRDERLPTRDPFLKWHARPNILDVHAAMQTWFVREERGKDDGRPNPSQNVQKTLRLLWDLRDDAERTAALLIAATAENAFRSGCGSIVLDDVQSLATEALGVTLEWHHSSAVVIPKSATWKATPPPRPAALDDAVALLASEHADRLREWAAVQWVFSDRMDPVCEAEMERREHVRAKQALVDARQAALRGRRAAQREQVIERRAPPDTDRLQPGMLQKLEKAELTQCVWSRPTQEAAALLGVSDVAVAKRCKALGVPKPPKGFWNKVAGGLIPHPRGVPIKDAETLAQGLTRNGRPRRPR